MRTWLLVLLLAPWAAAESYPVLSVPAGDRVVIQYRGLPIAVPLAVVTVPTDQEEAARQTLIALTSKQSVELIYLPEFGSDAAGSARVQLRAGKILLNEELIARGLARYQPSAKPSAAEGGLARAQDRAQKSGAGLWQGSTTAHQQAVAAKPAAAASVSGPFCSELDNDHYYASGAREVANVSAQRLIFYPDEATALKAGKKRAVKSVAIKRGMTEADADAAFASGKEITSNAVAAGNTSRRDELYEQAYQELTQAMQIYSGLVDQRPDDVALGEKLRECMQMRYGTVKMRRFH
jgi:hypothetical protein